MQIEVKYSCVLCGLQDVPCLVTARRTEDDVAEWLRNTVAAELMIDHQRRSPWCKARKFDEIRIPLAGTDMVGGPTVN